MVERLHHSNKRKLGRAIITHVAETKETCRARNGHDVAMVSAEHRGQELFQDPIAGEQVHAHRAYELFLLALNEGFKILDTRIVDYECHVTDIVANALTYGSDFFAAPKSMHFRDIIRHLF